MLVGIKQLHQGPLVGVFGAMPGAHRPVAAGPPLAGSHSPDVLREHPRHNVGPVILRMLAAVGHQRPETAIIGDVVGPAVEEAEPLLAVARPGHEDPDRWVAADDNAA